MTTLEEYPPVFTVSVTGELGQFYVRCHMCLEAQVWDSGTDLEDIQVWVDMHSTQHLHQLITNRGNPS